MPKDLTSLTNGIQREEGHFYLFLLALFYHFVLSILQLYVVTLFSSCFL